MCARPPIRPGLALDAWVGGVAVRVARREISPLPSDLGEVLAELFALRAQVRRAGQVLNQVAAAEHSGVPVAAGVAERAVERLARVVEDLDVLVGLARRRLS